MSRFEIADGSLLRLGVRAPTELSPARLSAHWALQIPAAAGATLAEARDDFSHTAFHVEAVGPLGAALPYLVGGEVPSMGPRDGDGDGGGTIRTALRIEDLTLLTLAASGETRSELALAGKTLDEGIAWLSADLGSGDTKLVRPTHELPDHATVHGAPFDANDATALAEIARWFANAQSIIAPWAAATQAEGASPLRWPHHFDLATLVTLDPGKTAEEARSFGVGFSPGDRGYPQPYFYVTPWPYPPVDALPKLEGGGVWNTAGWVGAVLTGEAALAQGSDSAGRCIAAFLDSAINAARSVLGS